ncbi:hypothetical protein H1C71_040582, partial [Ictidomys tridecemlineatus]
GVCVCVCVCVCVWPAHTCLLVAFVHDERGQGGAQRGTPLAGAQWHFNFLHLVGRRPGEGAAGCPPRLPEQPQAGPATASPGVAPLPARWEASHPGAFLISCVEGCVCVCARARTHAPVHKTGPGLVPVGGGYPQTVLSPAAPTCPPTPAQDSTSGLEFALGTPGSWVWFLEKPSRKFLVRNLVLKRFEAPYEKQC